MNGTFYEQLGGVAKMFEQWGTCERTVVACALARRVPWPGLRLVQRAVEAALQNHVGDERLERDANDETLLASLLASRTDEHDEEDGERLRQLLALLPLLRTDNERAKNVYVSATPGLVQRCVDSSRSPATPHLCRQLLSYQLVHPAFTVHDQRTLTQWLRYLENHISGNRNSETPWQQRIEPALLQDTNIWSANNTFRRTIGKNVDFRGMLDSLEHAAYTDVLQESFSKNGRDVDIGLDGDAAHYEAQTKSHRSNSLTPPSTNFMQMSSSAENLSDEPFVQKPRSFSLSSEHSLTQLRPIGVTYGTTGSETRLDDLRTNNFAEHPGMSTVGQWLKSLRLHKYVWLFTNITYEQMMAMDDKYLEKLGVTKGARHKILLSIARLSERPSILESVRSELSSGRVCRALDRLRSVLLSPMPPGDLPRAVVAALQHASECLSGGAGSVVAENEPEAVDPMSLHCWLIEKALHHESFSCPSLQSSLRCLRHRVPPRQFFHLVGDAPHRRLKPRWRAPAAARRRWAPPARGKSNSYPPFPPQVAPPPPHDYSSLDALCLQMTETAID
ncbi:Smaug protein 2 [Danaus plexippus plexippus]|uniref:Smaug protein 2 n=1 Tax=Danaus plexippus plexippus TaxID=278856 RepID=A0A212FJD8_DANPL|nr:Smaug protein 2 [Danaus plexippus plexippus]